MKSAQWNESEFDQEWLWKHSSWLFKAVVFEITTAATGGGGGSAVGAVFRKEEDKVRSKGETVSGTLQTGKIWNKTTSKLRPTESF